MPDGSRGAKGEEQLLRYFTKENFEKVAVYREIARREGVTLAQLATAFLLNTPGVTSAIVGASRPGHIAASAAVCDWKWSEELYREVASV